MGGKEPADPPHCTRTTIPRWLTGRSSCLQAFCASAINRGGPHALCPGARGTRRPAHCSSTVTLPKTHLASLLSEGVLHPSNHQRGAAQTPPPGTRSKQRSGPRSASINTYFPKLAVEGGTHASHKPPPCPLAVACCQTDVSLQEQQRAMQAATQGLQAETDHLRFALIAIYRWCFGTADRGVHCQQ